MADKKDTIIGIDLGTTNSVAASCDSDVLGPRVLHDESSFNVQPSVVSFHPNGSVLVGAEAKQRRVIDPKNTVYSTKRLIGRTYDSHEVTAAAARMPYIIKEGQNKQPVIATRAGEFAIPEISAIVLDHMRKISEKSLGGAVSRAVVTVPANFTDAQRSATATAGAIAGITVVRVLNEPTAAALAYGHQRKLDATIAVYDFGGGTFDISLLRLKDSVFEVLATAGDSFLGGDDIDERLVDYMVQLFLEQHRVDLRENEIAMQRLRAVAEQVKIELSRRTRAKVRVDEIAYGSGGEALDLELELTRDQFLTRVADIIESTFPICREAARMAGVGPQQLNDIVLVGGTTKMPFVRERVAQFFGKMPRTDVNPDEAVAVGASLQAMALERILGGGKRRASTSSGRRTDQGFAAAPAVSGRAPSAPPIPQPGERRPQRGAFTDAVLGSTPAPEGNAVARITRRGGTSAPPRSPTLSGATPPPVPRVPGMPATAGPDQATIPPIAPFDQEPTDIREEQTQQTQQPAPLDLDDLQTRPGPRGGAPGLPAAFDLPDPVATGAGIGIGVGARARPATPVPVPGGSGQPGGATVIDITPHSLGIATIAGFCEGIIARNSRVPTQTKKVFSTSRDKQDTVRIRVCQGESRRLDDNVVLGDLVLEGLQPRPRGETKIEVTFEINASGMLQVRAKDSTTGLEQRVNLSLLGAQSADEIAAAQARFRDLQQ